VSTDAYPDDHHPPDHEEADEDISNGGACHAQLRGNEKCHAFDMPIPGDRCRWSVRLERCGT
jgi:hypothetical protein